MGCVYELFGQKYTEQQLIQALKNDKTLAQKIASFEESYDPDEIEFDSDEEPTEVFLNKYDKLVQYKKSLISQLNNKIASLKSIIKKHTDKDKIVEDTKLQQKMENRVARLEEEIDEAMANRGIDLPALKYQAQLDKKRVEELLATGNIEDLAEAGRIINFYKAMRFSKNNVTVDKHPIEEHPFFEDDEIYDDNGDVKLEDATINSLNDMATTFDNLEANLLTARENFVTNFVNTDPRVKELYDKLTYAEITEALPDMSWVDMMITDMTKGIFSQNGVMPQTMMAATQGVFSEELAKNKKFAEAHDRLLPEVLKRLPKLSNLGILKVAGSSFDVFFQKTFNGKKTGRLVHRYDQTFFDERAAIENETRAEIESIKRDYDIIEERNRALNRVYRRKQDWFRENTLMFDFRALADDFADLAAEFPELAAVFQDDGGKHKQELLDNIDEIGYKQELEKQKKELRKYFAWKAAYKETFLAQKGVDNESDLSQEELDMLNKVIASQSPLSGVQYFFEGKGVTYSPNEKPVFPFLNFNLTIPRKKKLDKVIASDGSITYRESNVETGFYDKNFAEIEADPVLREYYDLVKGEMDRIMETLPEEDKKDLLVNFLPSVRKNITEKLIDSNSSFFKTIWDVLSDIYDRIRAGFGVNPQSQINFENTDIISGKPEYGVNNEFISNNKKKISQNFTILKRKFSQAMLNNGAPFSINKNSFIRYDQVPPAMYKTIQEMTGMSKQELVKQFGNSSFPIGNLLFQQATHDVVQDHSTNLPKIIKYYSMMASEYSARNKLKPAMEMMKNHYQQVKELQTNNVGKAMINKWTGKVSESGTRDRANTQMESWFNRVILGNSEPKHWGMVDSTIPEAGEKKDVKNTLRDFFTGRILSKNDKKIKKELDELIANETSDFERKRLEKIRQGLGKHFAASAAVENFMNYIRFLGLGYNLSSGVTNYLEGQTANIILAANGDYFTEEHFHRAGSITWGSFAKNFLGRLGYKPKGAVKLRTLMDKFDILQDSSNELQKASTKTALNSLENLHPMQINKRVEYLNQSPIMISIMLNTPIKDKNGNVSNVWDALDTDGTLKKEFKTPENIQTWETNEGDNFKEFKNKVNEAIVTAHGNYDKLRGMMAKESTAGRVLMMFKTWVGSALYGRFAVKRDDLTTGQKDYKGRYWSHTSSSGLLHGALAGFAVAGTGGLALGAMLGIGFGANSGIRSNIGLLQEMAFITKALVRKSFATPINFFGGSELIKTHPSYDKLKGKKFTDRDVKNMKANIADMALLMQWVALTLLTKAMFWDDEDEEDSPRRMMHNVFANRFLQLASSASSFVNPTALYDNLVGNIAIGTWCNNVKKTTEAFGEYLEGNDILASGTNAGNSRLAKESSKVILPSMARSSYLGFGSQMERQFTKTTYDDWFHSDNKKARKIMQGRRARMKKELLDEGYSEKAATRIVNKRLPMPKKEKKKNREYKD